MAYISAEAAKVIRQELKAAFPKVKFSVRIRHFSALSVTIMKAPFRFSDEDHCQLNHYHAGNYKNSDILKKMIAIINKKNWDRSDAMVDYFDVGFYLTMSQGAWDKPFVYTGK
jgi:hypothetical protein